MSVIRRRKRNEQQKKITTTNAQFICRIQSTNTLTHIKKKMNRKRKHSLLMRRNEARVKRETILYGYRKTMRKHASYNLHIQEK